MHVSHSIYSGFSPVKVTTNNNQVFSFAAANSEAATSRSQRFCLCLRLDNDINEAIYTRFRPSIEVNKGETRALSGVGGGGGEYLSIRVLPD